MITHITSCLVRCIILFSIILLWSCENKNASENGNKDSDVLLAKKLFNNDSYDSALAIYKKYSEQSFKDKKYSDWLEGQQGIIDCIKYIVGPDSAYNYCDSIYNLSKQYIDTNSTIYSSIIYKKGILYSDLRQLPLAKQAINRSIFLNKQSKTKQDSALALNYNALGTVYLLSGNYDSAFIYYSNAIENYEKDNKTVSADYAYCIQNIGILYVQQGNYEKAEEFFLKSISILSTAFKGNNSKLAANYVNMGRLYQIIRDDSKTLEYYKKAEAIYSALNLNNSINAGFLYLNMGATYIYTADYEKAIRYLNQSLQIIQEKASNNFGALQTIYLNLGYVAEKQKNYILAKENYLKGMALGNNLQNSVKILRGLASVSNLMNQDSEADIYYKTAVSKSIENYGFQNSETALTYLKYGSFLSEKKKNEAVVFLKQALEIYRNTFGDKNTDVSTAYFYLGRHYLNQNELQKSLSYLQLSLVSAKNNFNSLHLDDNPEFLKTELSENTLNPTITKASCLYLLYKQNPNRNELLDAANNAFDHAIKMMEQMRSTYQNEESKLLLSENMRSTLSMAVQAQFDLYNTTKSAPALSKLFEVCEKGKSAILLSYLRDVEAKNNDRIPIKLRKEDESIKKEIYAYNKLIYDESLKSNSDPTKISLWKKKLFDLNRLHEILIQRFEKEFPAYYKLKYDNSVVTPEQVQMKLTPSQVMISYTIADSTLYTFVFSKTTQKLYKKTLQASFFTELDSLRQSMLGQEFQNYSKKNYQQFVYLSHHIYNILIGDINLLTKGKELIIIPDAELSYIPFDVLLTETADTSKMNFKKLPYLIKSSSISYAPSASTFIKETTPHSSNHNNKILAFAPSYSKNNKLMNTKDEDGRMLKNQILELDNTSSEVNNLSYYKNVKIFEGEQATETLFKKQASRYRILHLAMHTLLNTENPLYSKLLFFQSENDTIDDGMLNASELLSMSLNADMAVLSACNTGTGKLQKGEGVMSLARDFFYAGVPSIVMTSWSAREKASEQLMQYFYKYLNEGKSKSEALQRAKLDFLEHSEKLTAHPHYWASYMVIGDISPLPSFSNRNMYFFQVSLFTFILSFIVIAGFLILRHQKKAKQI